MLRTLAVALILLGSPALHGRGLRGQEAPQPTRVSSGVMAGLLLTKVAPVYPADAKSAHVQGVVVLHTLIGANGTVKNLEPVTGPAELRKAAMDAVAQWTYRPYLLNGKAVEVDTNVTVRFTLADATADPRPARAVDDNRPATAPETVAPGAVEVPAQEMAARLMSRVNPTYPPDAKAKGISGEVVLSATIARDGTVSNLSMMSGPEDLRDTALEAVRQWVYRPYLVHGEAVVVRTTVTVSFTLGG